jgi:heat shock protein HslJ
MTPKKVSQYVLILWMIFVFIACQRQSGRRLSTEELSNAVYKSVWVKSGRVKLTNGEHREAAAPGSASEIVIRLTEKIAHGELNGSNAAVVILATKAGGSGTFYDLAVVVKQAETLGNIATTALGDRVKINSLAIENNEIIVDLVTHSPSDPMCCPTQEAVQQYTLKGDQLVKTSSPTTGQNPALPIIGVKWKLAEIQSMDDTKRIPDDPLKYTLELLLDGKASIQADCNRGFGTYKLNGSALTVEILGTTRAACPPGSLSELYIRQLGEVYAFVLKDNTLYLSLRMDSGILKFLN